MCNICEIPMTERKAAEIELCLVEMDDGTLIEMCRECEQDVDEYHSVLRSCIV